MCGECNWIEQDHLRFIGLFEKKSSDELYSKTGIKRYKNGQKDKKDRERHEKSRERAI